MNEQSTLQEAGGTWPRGFAQDGSFAWPLVRADKLVTLNYGKALLEGNRRVGTIPVYGTNGQCGWHDRGLANGPGLILGRKGMGNLGVEWTLSDYWVIDTAYYVTPKRPDVDLKFFYYLTSFVGLNHLKDGTSNPSLSRDTFYAQLFPCPPIQVQRRIADSLGSLDDKIELNRRMSETLEAMARTLFRSWFVDFDPVRAKVDGQKPQSMNAATAKLFPDSFEPSVLGPIPMGWRVAPLGEFVEVAKGLSYKGDGLAPVGLPLHNLNSVYEGGGYKYEGIKHYIGEYRPVHVARAGDLIVTNTEQGHDHLLIGYSAIVPKRYGNDGLFSHHIFRVRPLPASSLTSQFIHHMLLTPRFRGEVIGFTNGTTVNMLHADGLKKPRLVLPPPQLIQRFTEFAESLSDKAESNRDQSRTLAVTRDALLPKLLSGEVRVGDAESLVREVV